eukprot:Hpha_TRINITY_DN16249_c0_g5::TRINITY_DN16249_c0_g5_i1::g.12646::m.12646
MLNELEIFGMSVRRSLPPFPSLLQDRKTSCPSSAPDLLAESVSSWGSGMSGSTFDVPSVRRMATKRSRVSLAVANMIGYLSSGDLAGEANSKWLCSDVERWCTAVASAKGVVDLIGGDRRYASFNARQVC